LGVRSIRFYDLLAVRRVEASRAGRLLWPAPLDAMPSAASLALASAWQDVNQTVFTFVQRERGAITGLAQMTARPTRDAWDLVRLAIPSSGPHDHALLPDDQERERIADDLLDAVVQATGSRGGLRTFARAPADREGLDLLTRRGFRRYADEYTLSADYLDLTPAPLPARLSLSARHPADAWGIFQLYCSLAPAEARHAEGLSSKRWSRGSLAAATVDRLRRPREIVLHDEGTIVGWVRLTKTARQQPQRLEVMLHPGVGDVLPALLTHAAVALDIRRDRRTVCHVRAYEDTVLRGLRRVGFEEAAAHALLVKHAVARVTERQLLLAALRAQSLGLDVSHYQQPNAPRSLVPRQVGRVGMTTLEHTQHD